MIFVVLLLTTQSCKKEVTTQPSDKNTADFISNAGSESSRPGHCRLAYLHYEESGFPFFIITTIVDWSIILPSNYGDGLPDIYTFTYKANGIMNGGTTDVDLHTNFEYENFGGKRIKNAIEYR